MLKASSFIRFLDVRFSKRYFLKIELIQDIEIAHRQFRLVTRSKSTVTSYLVNALISERN
ncbi:hypothetical protein FAJ39_05775 [Streptococcus suis]|uniref:Uncharacterized protein n=1 Tax=Streptococcus suis TaxID=1307 RepID=A0A4T2GLZ8_STRSU|nr:hypothetical protein FAJ39_05775 [Streptococcus suis]